MWPGRLFGHQLVPMWLPGPIIDIPSADYLGGGLVLEACLRFVPMTQVFGHLLEATIESGSLLNAIHHVILLLQHLRNFCAVFPGAHRLAILVVSMDIWVANLHHCFWTTVSSAHRSIGLAGVLLSDEVELWLDCLNRFDVTNHGIWDEQKAVQCRVIKALYFQFLISLRTELFQF